MMKFTIAICLALWGLSALAYGPYEAIARKPYMGRDFHWFITTSNPDSTLELDCQSFINYFHINKKDQRELSIAMTEHGDCEVYQEQLEECLSNHTKACVTGNGMPVIECGACPVNQPSP